MKRWGVVFALAVVTVLAVADLVHEFVSNDTIEYFSSRPRRLVLVVTVAIGGGLVAAALDGLSHQAKRSLRLIGWGAAALFVTYFSVYCAYKSFALSPIITSAAGGHWALLIPLMFAGLAAYFWFEFYRAWKSQIRV